MSVDLTVVDKASGAQQKDNLCGPFWAARVLNESGFTSWDGEQVDEDLIALRAGTALPDAHAGADVPPGAIGRTAYRYALPTASIETSGTSPGGLAAAIECASAGALRCVQIRGSWNAERVERLVDEGRSLGARLIANLRTGMLWASRPPIGAILNELEGLTVEDPAADWDVGHYVDLEMLIRGPRRSLVVVHDSYPSLGWEGRHLQPPRVLAAALIRGDGREGGVLAVVPKAGLEGAQALVAATGLDVGTWNNGAGS